MNELENLFYKRFKGRRSAFAQKNGNGYFTVRRNGKDIPLKHKNITKHLKGDCCLGIYLMRPGGNKVHFATLDVDNHDGDLDWSELVEKVRPITNELSKRGLFPLSFRSTSGKGIHISISWRKPQKAKEVRAFLEDILKSCGYSEGTNGGIKEGKVEIFPKQNSVPINGYGSLIALPLSGNSVPLDSQLRIKRKSKALKIFEKWKYSPPVPKLKFESKKKSFVPGNGGDASTLMDNCLFVQHCKKEAKSISEPLWHSLASNLALVKDGDDLFHELSRPYHGYTHKEGQKKLDNAIKASAPHNCQTIADKGFHCPNMNHEGRCSLGGVRSPVNLSLNVKDQIQNFSQKSKLSQSQKHQYSDLILNDLIQMGQFYKVKGTNELLYFNQVEKELYLLSSKEFRSLCNELYKINGSQTIWNFVEEDLIKFCIRNGHATEIYHFARYQDECLYIHGGKHKVFRTSKGEIEEINNGDDGILFCSNNQIEPVEPNYLYKGSPIRELLVDILNITEEENKTYILDLYECYIYSLFYESILPTKPIILFQGIKGSGKTSAARALKVALFGKESQVDTGLTDKEDAFWAAVSNSYLLCIDNVDSMVRWLGNAVSIVSTGADYSRRDLYKTNTLVKYKPRCFLMFTSRNPISFQRDDVADRLFLICIERRKNFKSEKDLLDEIHRRRGDIWGELLCKHKKILRALKKNKCNLRLPFRLADWSNFVLTISPVLGIKNPMKMLGTLEKTKRNFVLEENIIAQTLDALIPQKGKLGPYSSGELFRKIVSYHELRGNKFPINEPKHFGVELKNLVPELEWKYKIKIEKGPNNTKIIEFIRKRKGRRLKKRKDPS